MIDADDGECARSPPRVLTQGTGRPCTSAVVEAGKGEPSGRQHVATALELLGSCPVDERASRRDDLLRAVNNWSDESRRAGRPLAAVELDEVVMRVNDILWTGSMWRSPCVVRVGGHIYDSRRLRFH